MKQIIALGTENKTTFTGLSGTAFFMSKPAGDITEIGNFLAYEKAVRGFLKDRRMTPDYIACDAHPDYSSTILAGRLREEYRMSRIVRVQHHFAHIVSCMEDNGLDGEVIGVSFDGTGYGADGLSWGGEFLRCTKMAFERKYHLKYVPQPGGDAAAREGWRMALSYLIDAYSGDIDASANPVLHRVGMPRAEMIRQMVERNVNSPLTSSAGRLFDAVASLLGVCDESAYGAEAAIRLEKETVTGISGSYGYGVYEGRIDLSRMIRGINDELRMGVPRGAVSARFHNTLGEIIYDVASRMSGESGIRSVLISGGCFQNAYLREYLERRFAASGIKLYKHRRFPATDLGVSVGQAVAAAHAEEG